MKEKNMVTKFMDRLDNEFFWPKHPDIQDVLREQILCKINSPGRVKKTKRIVYCLNTDEYEIVNLLSENSPIYEL